jgi:hypothetical protein
MKKGTVTDLKAKEEACGACKRRIKKEEKVKVGTTS